jgi:hypothetical protein
MFLKLIYSLHDLSQLLPALQFQDFPRKKSYAAMINLFV